MPEEPRKKIKIKREPILGAEHQEDDYGYSSDESMRGHVNRITDPRYSRPLKNTQIQGALKYIRRKARRGPIPDNWRWFMDKHTSSGSTMGELMRKAQEKTGTPVIQRSPEEEKPDLAGVEMLLYHFQRDSSDIEQYLQTLSDRDLAEIPFNIRKEMIVKMSEKFWVGDRSETGIIRLLETTPAAHSKNMLSWLQSENASLLKRFEDSIQGENYRTYHQVIRQLYFQSMDPDEAYAKMLEAQQLPWSSPGFMEFMKGTKQFVYEVKYLESGKIHVRISPTANIMPVSLPFDFYLNPFDMVMIRMDTGDPEMGMQEGKNIFVPALTLHAMENQQQKLYARFVLDFSLLAMGGAGLAAAKTIPAFIFASLDIAMGVGDMAINEYRTTIAESDEGLKFLQAWDGVQLLLGVYGISRLIVEAPHIFRHLKRVYGEYRASRIAAKNPEIIHELNEKLKAIIDDPDVAKYLEEAEKRRLAGKTDGVSEIELDQPRGLESRGEGKPYIVPPDSKYIKASKGAQNYIDRFTRSSDGILDLGHALEGKRLMTLFEDMNDIFLVLNREVALVKMKKGGKFLMVLGELPGEVGNVYQYTVNRLNDIDDIEIIAHTHPIRSFISQEDLKFLVKRGQTRTYLIITEQGVYKYENIRKAGINIVYELSDKITDLKTSGGK